MIKKLLQGPPGPPGAQGPAGKPADIDEIKRLWVMVGYLADRIHELEKKNDELI